MGPGCESEGWTQAGDTGRPTLPDQTAVSIPVVLLGGQNQPP